MDYPELEFSKKLLLNVGPGLDMLKAESRIHQSGRGQKCTVCNKTVQDRLGECCGIECWAKNGTNILVQMLTKLQEKYSMKYLK